MKIYEDWEGTMGENIKVMQCIAKDIHEKMFPQLDPKTFNQVFIEAFTRNIVQNELTEMMAYIYDMENPI